MAAEAEQAHGACRGHLHVRGGVAVHDHRVEHLECLGRPPGVGQQQGAATLDEPDARRRRDDGVGLVQRGERTLEVALRREAGPRQAARQRAALGIGELVLQGVGDDAFDVVVLAEEVVRLAEHLGASEGVGVVAVRQGVDETNGQVRVVPGECQAGGTLELVAGDTAARLDAPQGHLHHVLAAA